MGQVKIKILTFFLSLFFVPAIFSEVVTVENAKTHLRLKISANKEQVTISKKGDIVEIKSLDENLFQSFSSELLRLPKKTKYIEKIYQNPVDLNNSVKTLTLKLSGQEVELFTFYKEREKLFVMDFWSDTESLLAAEKKEKTTNLPEIKKKEVIAPKVKGSHKKGMSLLKRPVAMKESQLFKKKKQSRKLKKSEYRDFRYGSSVIWDYSPIAPKPKTLINLSRKTPEYFYPIKNRKYKDSDKEAHLQLSINLFNKKKWGLMYKSIKLFSEKYGEDDNISFLEYLKANAILRESLEKGHSRPVKTAIAMLTTIAKRTKNYDMQKGIYKYLITFKLSVKDYAEALEYSKKYYVISKNNFDYEESRYAAESILYTLTQLRQVEKLNEIIKDKTIQKLIPKQLMLAYQIYTLTILGKTEDVIKLYNQAKAGLVSPVDPTILFNVGESYFREAKYQKSIDLFDRFITHYSLMTSSSRARLRLALSYEILDKDMKQTSALYKDAINNSQNQLISFEAKMRLVALRTIRKRVRSDKDNELRVLLETENQDIKNDKNIKRLLWLTRMRTFLADKKYKKALSYLNAIPLNILLKSEKRVFEGDGAEAIYGIMLSNYKNGEYSKVIKAWEVYREKYVRKVATDAYLNFIVGKSYIKIGLYDGFDEVYKSFEKLEKTPHRTFPIWVKRDGLTASNIMLHELMLIKNIKLENWEQALAGIKKMAKAFPSYKKTYYYRGIVNYKTKNYKGAVRDLEDFIAFQSVKKIYDPAEIAEILLAYTDSIYRLGNVKKYKKAAKAILSDTKKFGLSNEYIVEIKERISYLLIEILASENNKNERVELVYEIKNFLKVYKKTTYKGRIKYLLGLTLVEGSNETEGIFIFKSILKDKGISDYIKEMVKSELSLLNIKNKII